jgi:hypothetical protein
MIESVQLKWIKKDSQLSTHSCKVDHIKIPHIVVIRDKLLMLMLNTIILKELISNIYVYNYL